MDRTTVLVVLGAICLLLSLVRGGVRIKEIEIPKFKMLQTVILFIFGLIFILAGFGLLPEIAQVLKNSIPKKQQNISINRTTKTEKPDLKPESREQPKPKPPEIREPVIRKFNPGSASLKSADKLVACQRIYNKDPKGIYNQFTYGKVYAWAQVYTPSSDSVTLQWLNPLKEVIRSRTMYIVSTYGNGYRIYDFKIFHPSQEGLYELRLLDGSKEIIGTREFLIVSNKQMARKQN